MNKYYDTIHQEYHTALIGTFLYLDLFLLFTAVFWLSTLRHHVFNSSNHRLSKR